MNAMKSINNSLSVDCEDEMGYSQASRTNSTECVAIVKRAGHECITHGRKCDVNVVPRIPSTTNNLVAPSNINIEHGRAKTKIEVDNATCGRKLVVLISAFLSVALSFGYSFYMSVLYVEWLQEFGKSNVETALVQSVCSAVFAFGGVLSGIFVTKFGQRTCCITSGFLSCSGIAVSYFAPNIIFLVFSLGTVSGMAFSIAYVSTMSSVGLYFKGKQKSLAMAFVACGSGASGAVFPTLMEELISAYGWRGSMLVLAGINLNTAMFGCVFMSPSKKIENRKTESNSSAVSDEINKEELHGVNLNKGIIDDKACRSDVCKTTNLSGSRKQAVEVAHMEKEHGTGKNSMEVIKRVLKNKVLIWFCFTYAVYVSTIGTFYTFFVDYFTSKGLTRTDSVGILFYMNIFSIAVRLGLAFFTQIRHVSVFFIPVLSSVFGCLSMVLFMHSGSSFSLNTTAALALGSGIGGIRISTSVCVAKLVEQENFPTAIGLSMTILGVFGVTLGPLSGLVLDRTDGYHVYILLLAASQFLAFVSYFMIMVYRHCTQNNKGFRNFVKSITTRVSLCCLSPNTKSWDTYF